MDDELKTYRKLIGSKEYQRQYYQLYSESRRNKRYSENEYENSPEKLNRIKTKYKNGVSKQMINEMLGVRL